MPSIRILAPIGEEYTTTLPVVTVSVPDSVGFMVVTTGVGWVTATVVFTGGAVVCDVATVVSVVGTVVCDVATVVSGVGTVVCDVALVVCDVVTLSALTGSTMSSIVRNTATGMTDNLLSRDIDKILPAGFTVDFLQILHCCDGR
jgi:hypothetical protein